MDSHHSDAQLITDATTDYGKTENRRNTRLRSSQGASELDNNDLAKSSFDLRIYPANAMMPDIDEDGKFLSEWLSNLSNHTLVCFHSKGAARTADGRLQTTGNLILTRVDRNVEANPTEAYAGPVYGAANGSSRFARSHFRFRRSRDRREDAERRRHRDDRDQRICSAKIFLNW